MTPGGRALGPLLLLAAACGEDTIEVTVLGRPALVEPTTLRGRAFTACTEKHCPNDARRTEPTR